jgi:hypothetical protein
VRVSLLCVIVGCGSSSTPAGPARTDSGTAPGDTAVTPTVKPLWARPIRGPIALDGKGDVAIVSRWFGALGGEPTGTGPIVIAKFRGGDGAFAWARRLEGSENGMAIVADAAGNVVASTIGPAVAPAGFPSLQLTKLAADGSVTWQKTFSGAGEASASSVAMDASGNVLVVGSISGSNFDLGGGSMAAPLGIFVAKYAPDGSHQWSHRMAGASGAKILGGFASNGDVLAVAWAARNLDVEGAVVSPGLLRFDAAGTFIRTTTAPESLAMRVAGDVFVAGAGALGGGFDDGFVARLGADDGARKWQWQLATKNTEWTSSVDVDAAGHAFATGQLGAPLTTAGITLTPGRSAYVVELSPNGELLAARTLPGTKQSVGTAVRVNDTRVFVDGYYEGEFPLGEGVLTPIAGGENSPFLLAFPR